MDVSRISEIFRECDVDGDGMLSREEMRVGLRRLSLPSAHASIDRFIDAIDASRGSSGGKVSHAQFVAAVLTQQERLVRAFKEIDRGTGDGRITSRDIERFASTLGHTLSHDEVARLVAHIDRDKDGVISSAEFCEFFLTHVGDVHAEGLFESWLKSSSISSIAIPDPAQDDTPAWALLTAGALAGIVSRTLTAPADRVKTMLQAAASPSPPSPLSAVASAIAHSYTHADGAEHGSMAGATRPVYRYGGATVQASASMPLRHAELPASHTVHVHSFGGVMASLTTSARKVSAHPHARVALSPASLHALLPDIERLPRPRYAQVPVSLHARTVRSAISAIYHDGGIPAFWRGNGINVMKVAPETAARFWTYESLKAWLCEDPDNITLFERFLAGAGAGATAQALIYPLEVAKTRMALSARGEYRGLAHCVSTTVRSEGVPALYRGMLASLVGIIPYSGVDLTVFSLLKEGYEARFPDSEPGVVTLLLCGAVSTTVGQVVSYPLQLVRTRLQAQGMPGRPVVYEGVLDCFAKTVRREGLRGLYRGILPNFMVSPRPSTEVRLRVGTMITRVQKSVPAMAISYATYELSKRALSRVAKRWG